MARGSMDPRTRRKLWIFIAMVYAILPLIGLEIYLGVQDETAWAIAAGAAVVCCFVGIFVWAGRNGLTGSTAAGADLIERYPVLLSFAATGALVAGFAVFKTAGIWLSVPLFVVAAALLAWRIALAVRDGRARARAQGDPRPEA